ncbi:hypothetical protein BMS3Abin05_02265 [bacterium BMS3Abin05]|nr:hypothetical protein BMS3Abin05_02265 [bacterium BMS3Abin05]GBE28704.1 hypothetical protein BMS3Bbin03_02654 [bacterium BMS3Bbin03]
MKKHILLFFMVLWLVSGRTFAQDSSKTNTQPANSAIKLSTQIDRTQVPLNRTVLLRASLTWEGDPDRYEIVDFENPALTNLEIIGTSTSNKTEVTAGKVFTRRDYAFTLKPRELGMGYVEGIIIKYRDPASDKEYSLVTQRISLKVTDPVPEGHAAGHWPVTILYAAIIIIIIGLFWFFLVYKKSKKTGMPIEEVPPIEETYLRSLKEMIDFNKPDLKNDFSQLSKHLRNYLAEKFDLPAIKTTTIELIRIMEEREMEERLISQTKEVLGIADEIKFTGRLGSREELEKIYGSVESILERQLTEAKAALSETDFQDKES